MEIKPMNIGVIGTGMISGKYLDTLRNKFTILKLVAVADMNPVAANAAAERYHVKAVTVDELLADESIDVVLNLTPPTVHYEMLKRILLAGKHAYTEKTFTMNTKEAKELIELAEEKHLYIGSAPDTFFASWVQNARAVIDSRGVGVADMAWAIREGRESRVSKERCYHVLEIEEKMVESNEKNGAFCNVESTCTRSIPLSIPTDTEESSLLTTGR